MSNSISFPVLIVLCLTRIVCNQLVIKPTESVVSRDQFKPFIALCTGQKNTQVVSWQSPASLNIEVNPNARITIERKSSGLRLRIRNLTRNDQGIWKCSGVDQDGKSFSSALQINVKVPITFISEPIQYAELNTVVLIKCQVLANPLAEISWFKGQEKLNVDSSNYEQKDNGLQINRISSIDNDTFWCQADVMETGESKDFQIQVILAQAIRSTRITCLIPCAVEKKTATLICESNGIPPPRYLWFYGQDGPFIVNGMSKFITRDNRLIINYIDETDNGRYSCHAFNDYDQKGQKTDYLLNVIIPLQLSRISPMEITIDENFPSQRATFSCRIERGSWDNLSLEWVYANNTPVQTSNGISIDSTQLQTHRLIELNFNPIRREHHGNYTCIGKNLADKTSVVAHLFVQYKPVLIEPKITDVYSASNHQVIMTCQFDSYPPPVIQWMKITTGSDHTILDDIHPRVIDISTKQIGSTFYKTELTYKPSLDDFGLKFQCQADNSRIEKHSIILRRAELPRQVRITEIKPTSNTIELHVQPPTEFTGLPLTQYIVRYEQIDIPNSTRMISFPVISNQSQSVEIKSLQAASSYRIQIAVESQAGQSTFSTPVQAKTFNGKVPQFNLTDISCLDNTSYLIKWVIKSDGGSSISRTEVSYAKIHGGNKIKKWNTPIHIEPNMTEYVLNGLETKSNYVIGVRLFNIAGYGEQQIRKMTTCEISSPRQANIWISLGIIAMIIIGTVIICLIFILNRIVCERIVH